MWRQGQTLKTKLSSAVSAAQPKVSPVLLQPCKDEHAIILPNPFQKRGVDVVLSSSRLLARSRSPSMIQKEGYRRTTSLKTLPSVSRSKGT